MNRYFAFLILAGFELAFGDSFAHAATLECMQGDTKFRVSGGDELFATKITLTDPAAVYPIARDLGVDDGTITRLEIMEPYKAACGLADSSSQAGVTHVSLKCDLSVGRNLLSFFDATGTRVGGVTISGEISILHTPLNEHDGEELAIVLNTASQSISLKIVFSGNECRYRSWRVGTPFAI